MALLFCVAINVMALIINLTLAKKKRFVVTVFRNDRIKRIGGRVAIYVRSNISVKVVIKSLHIVLDFIHIEIPVSCVYNLNRNNSLNPFFDSLSDIVTSYNFVTICGDINVNLF